MKRRRNFEARNPNLSEILEITSNPLASMVERNLSNMMYNFISDSAI